MAENTELLQQVRAVVPAATKKRRSVLRRHRATSARNGARTSAAKRHLRERGVISIDWGRCLPRKLASSCPIVSLACRHLFLYRFYPAPFEQVVICGSLDRLSKTLRNINISYCPFTSLSYPQCAILGQIAARSASVCLTKKNAILRLLFIFSLSRSPQCASRAICCPQCTCLSVRQNCISLGQVIARHLFV